MGIEVERDTKPANDGPLATLPELAALLVLSVSTIKRTLHRAGVRYVEGAPRRYPTADALAAIEPHRAELEAQRERGLTQQAAEKAAADARRAERAGAHAKVMASNARQAGGATTPVTSSKHTSAFPPPSRGTPSPSTEGTGARSLRAA
jgi:hypothetical protein